MRRYQHTRAAQMQIALDYFGHAHAEYVDLQGAQEELLCGECGETTLYVNYDLLPPKCGCKNNDCWLRSTMTVIELLEEYWDEERDGELPDSDKDKRARLGTELAEICEAKMVEEERDREAHEEGVQSHISGLKNKASKLEDEKGELEGKVERLNQNLKQANQDKSAAQTKLHRKIEKKELDGALLTGALSTLYILTWLGMFLPRAALSGGGWWAYLVPVLCIAYGAAVGYAFYQERVRPQQGGKKATWYERLDLRRLGLWVGKAVVVLMFPLLFVDDVVGFGPVVRFAPPGSFEHFWIAMVVGVGLALGFQIWASRD